MRLVIALSFIVLFSGCITRPDAATSESSVLDVFGPISNSDALPIPGSNGVTTIAFMGSDSMEVHFTLASDDNTSQGALLYKVVHAPTLDELSPVSTALFDWQTFDSGVLTITDMEAKSYYLLLMVKDNKGQISRYQPFTNAPILPSSTAISPTAITGNSIDLGWEKASHIFLNPTVLQYQLYVSDADNMKTLADTRANGTLISDWTANQNSFSVTGLDTSTTYYFNVVVKTPFGAEVLYGSGEEISTL